MTDGSTSPDIAVAEREIDAIDMRSALEGEVFKKGLIRRVNRVVILPDGRKINREGFIVPDRVQEAFKSDSTYREIYGISQIEVHTDNSGDPVVGLNLADGVHDKAIHFSIGSGGVERRNHRIEFFSASRSGPESQISYYFRDNDLQTATNKPGVWSKIEPEARYALSRLKRFSDEFKPSVRERITGGLRRIIPSR